MTRHAPLTALAEFDSMLRRRGRSLAKWNATIFVCSLPFGAYSTTLHGESAANGFGLLLVGWLGLPIGYFEWIANPLLLTAWICLWIRRPGYAASFAAAACAIAVAFMLRDKVLINEAGDIRRIISLDTGYWLWVASTATTLASAIALIIQNRRRPSPCTA